MKKSVASVINEKMLLDHLSNPFIINTHQAFQDRDYLYLLMEYLRGGDLRYHLCYK
jgi:serum/glucocorticoid-regulated kinase 2